MGSPPDDEKLITKEVAILYRLLSPEMMSDFIFAYVYTYSSSEPFRKERIYIFILLIRLIFSKPNAEIAS